MTLPLYHWRDPEFSPEQNPSLPSVLAGYLFNVHPELAESPEALNRFLSPRLAHLVNPGKMPGVAEAVEKLNRVIDNGGEIVVFGDFDADGVTATALLTSIIRRYGGGVRPFIPTREEGYGLSEEALSRCLEGGIPDLLITVDCGMGAAEALQRFIDLGCEVIVTDHHLPGKTELPEACTVVSNHHRETPSELKDLCGAGIAFKVASGLVIKRYPVIDEAGKRERMALFSWMEAVALATVADVVPLSGENRTIVSAGLRRLSATQNKGLQALLRETIVSVPPGGYTTFHLGFVLGPHINAAGRMKNAQIALDLLLSEDLSEARRLASLLKESNVLRKTETEKAYREAEAILANGGIFDASKDGAVVVSGRDWAPGIIGLIAARLSEKYHRPAIAITETGGEDCRGSVRVPQGYHAYNALTECAEHLTQFGGHESAAGLELKKEKIAAFRNAFSRTCFHQVNVAFLTPVLALAGELDFGMADDTFLSFLKKLEPYGEENPEPVWVFRNVSATPRIIGKQEPKTLLLTLTCGNCVMEAVWFKQAEYFQEFQTSEKWDIAGTLHESVYNGETQIKIFVTDAKPATAGGIRLGFRN